MSQHVFLHESTFCSSWTTFGSLWVTFGSLFVIFGSSWVNFWFFMSQLLVLQKSTFGASKVKFWFFKSQLLGLHDSTFLHSDSIFPHFLQLETFLYHHTWLIVSDPLHDLVLKRAFLAGMSIKMHNFFSTFQHNSLWMSFQSYSKKQNWPMSWESALHCSPKKKNKKYFFIFWW